MSTPFFQAVDPAGAPDPVTPHAAPSDPAGYAKVTPPGTGAAPAPYDISAPQDIAGIAAAVSAAGALSGGQEGDPSGAGHLYAPGPRQAEARAILESPQGAPSSDVFAGFPDYENQDVRPGGNMENPVQGQGPAGPDYPGTIQEGIPQYPGPSHPLEGVAPEAGSMGGSAGGDYPGTLQDGLTKYGTS